MEKAIDTKVADSKKEIFRKEAQQPFFAPIQTKPFFSPAISKNAPGNMIQTMRPLDRSTTNGVRRAGEEGLSGVYGDEYNVQTDAGSATTGWVAYSGVPEHRQYWCHGHSLNTFRRWNYFVFSGDPLRMVLANEYEPIQPWQIVAGNLAVWEPSFAHSALVSAIVFSGSNMIDEAATMMSTKNGGHPHTFMSLGDLKAFYARRPATADNHVQFYRRR
jgi:hypothetical protein